MWTFQFERTFQKSFRSLDAETSHRVENFIATYQNGVESPFSIPNFRLMVGRENRGRFRLGGYRIGVILNHKTRKIHCIFVGSRGDFYKRFR